ASARPEPSPAEPEQLRPKKGRRDVDGETREIPGVAAGGAAAGSRSGSRPADDDLTSGSATTTGGRPGDRAGCCFQLGATGADRRADRALPRSPARAGSHGIDLPARARTGGAARQ